MVSDLIDFSDNIGYGFTTRNKFALSLHITAISNPLLPQPSPPMYH